MIFIILVFIISLGLQLISLACPEAYNFSRKIVARTVIGCLAIALLFSIVASLISIPLYPFLPVLLASFIALQSVFPQNNQWRIRHCFNLSLSLPLGLGLISFLWFVWLASGGRSASVPFSVIVCAVSFAVSILLLIIRRRKQETVIPEPPKKTPRHYFVEISFALGGVCSLLHIACQLAREPLGLWDAWMLWNTRAHFLYRSGADWMQQFTGHEMFEWLHPDYPLLLPASISAMWQLLGHESVTAPFLISGLFTLAAIFALTLGVSLIRTRTQGYLAGLAMMGLPVLYLFGCSQEADVPLAVYMLCALTCFSLHQQSKQNGLLYLAGTFVGMAAWTKNEGSLFALVFSVAAFSGLWLTGQVSGSRLRKMLSLFLGLLPWLVLLLLFKILLAPGTDLFQQSSSEIVAKLTDVSRYSLLINAFAVKLKWFGLPFFVFYLVLFGLRFSRTIVLPLLVMALTVTGMFVGYFFIYVISPAELNAMLNGSQERLLLQIWPSLLLLIFSVVQTPEDLYSRFSEEAN